jgi:hypothetical protein
MRTLTERVNCDDRLRDITIVDEQAQSFPTTQAAPVLATPAVVGGLTLVAAGAAYGEAID